MTYNWHEMNDNEFLHWVLPVALSPVHHATMEALSEATDRFTKVTITMQVNGIEVNGEKLLTRLNEVMNDRVKRVAAELVEEDLRFFNAEDLVADTFKAAREAIKTHFEAKGLTFRTDDD